MCRPDVAIIVEGSPAITVLTVGSERLSLQESQQLPCGSSGSSLPAAVSFDSHGRLWAAAKVPCTSGTATELHVWLPPDAAGGYQASLAGSQLQQAGCTAQLLHISCELDVPSRVSCACAVHNRSRGNSCKAMTGVSAVVSSCAALVAWVCSHWHADGPACCAGSESS